MTNEIVQRNGLGIPLVGFGTYLVPAADATKCVLEALKIGYRHIDTAELYQNEQAVGDAIKQCGIPREEIFITTKLNPGYKRLNMEERNYQQSIEAFNISLQKLQVDYVDLYLVHHPLAKETRLEQYKALVDLQKQGVIKHIGVSNYGIAHLTEIEKSGLPMPAVNQLEIHPMLSQSKILEYMKAHNILPIAYSSLAPLANWRTAEGDVDGKLTQPKKHQNDKLLSEISSRYKVSKSQLLLKWALQHDFCILPKSLKSERILENYQLWHFNINDDDMKSLDNLDCNFAMSWASIDINPVEEP